MLKGHGGEVYDLSLELGIPIDKIRDFSSNVSSYPLPDWLQKGITEFSNHIRYLPQIKNSSLRKLFARFYSLYPEWVLAGSGTTEFIYLLPKVINPGRIVFINPTYADYISSAIWNDIPFLELGPLVECKDYVNFILYDLKKFLRENDLVFICNPNNPTGFKVYKSELLSLVRSAEKVYWVIDESYVQFLKDEEETSLMGEDEANLIILRSFSKILGIPGLRLGFMISRPSIIKKMEDKQFPWNISTISQKLGEYILSLQKELNDYINAVRSFYLSEKEYFLSCTKRIKEIAYVNGDAHFMLFRLVDGRDFSPIYNSLKNEGLLVRNCHNFRGLDSSFFRICPRSREENILLLNRLEKLLGTNG